MKQNFLRTSLTIGFTLLILLLSLFLLPQKAEAASPLHDSATDLYYTVSGGKATIVNHGNSMPIDLVIPETLGGYPVIGIAENAIMGGVLKSVTIPSSITQIGRDAFLGYEGLEGVYISDLAAWCNINFNSKTANPLYYAKDLYVNGTVITDLVIPNGVTRIKSYAFFGCANFTSVSLPSSVTSIDSFAFSDCTGLKNVYVANLAAWCKISFGVGANPLAYAENLYANGTLIEGDIVIPSEITTILYATFREYGKLTGVTFPDSIKDVSANAFYGCANLERVNLGNNMEVIGPYAFSNCPKLTTVTVGSKLKTVEKYAFQNCAKLSAFTLPQGVETLEDLAFDGCAKLTSVTLPNSMKTIGSQVFQNCSGLTSVTFGNGLTSLGNGTFLGCSSLTSISIPEGIKTLEANTFSGCTKLTSVKLPESLKEIGQNAFKDCTSLKTLDIPQNVTTLCTDCFAGCSSLESVYFYSSKFPTVQDNGGRKFMGGSDSLVFYFPFKLQDSKWYFIPIKEFCGNGHIYSKWETITEPSCSSEGLDAKTCTVCGYQYTETFPKKEHEYGEWQIVTAATEDADGLSTRTCTLCNHTEVQILPKLSAETTENTALTPSTDSDSAETGNVTTDPATENSSTQSDASQTTNPAPTEESSFPLWTVFLGGGILLIAGCATGWYFLIFRKKKS